MARDKINHSHGDSGDKPPDGDEFAGGERPDPQFFDWFWTSVIDRINGFVDEFNRLDSNDDGQVDAADYADDSDLLDGFDTPLPSGAIGQLSSSISALFGGTEGNKPTAGSTNRWYFTEQNGIYYDDGSSWQLVAEHPSNISASDLGFDPATQTELDNHEGTADAHHARPSGGDGLSFDRSNNRYDADLGNALGVDGNGNIVVQESAISHDNVSGVSSADHHSRYADGEARSAVEAGDVTTVQYANAQVREDGAGAVEVRDAGNTGYYDFAVARVQLTDGVGWFTGSHSQLSAVSANDHHAAHEHPGDRTAQSNVDFNHKQAENMILDKRSSQPSSPAVGQIWYREDLD